MRWRGLWHRVGAIGLGQGLVAASLLVLIATGPTVAPAWARQLPPDYSPASGHAQVIAQGVVELPAEEVAWRTVRYRALLPAEAPFLEQPLGFVLATTAPIVLVDQATGKQTRLGPGEAVLVEAGTVQQRASLGERPAGFLVLELVPTASAPDVGDATVLQTGQPFVPSPGLHDLDLVRDVLSGSDTLTIPDTGEQNVILVTDGLAAVGQPGREAATLLAGEGATFAGEIEIAVAASGNGEPTAEDRATVVVAMIGPEVLPVAAPTPEAALPTPTEASVTPGATAETAPAGTGSITVEVFTCPPGMRAENLAVGVCAPATGDFDLTLSGDALETPLTLADATTEDGTYAWRNLPFGSYVLAEAVLPVGYDTYVVSAADATGSPESGYTVTLDAETPEVVARVYNFAPAPTGSLTVQVFTCPRGMGPENLVGEACRPATGDFDFTLSGDALQAPLTVADAVDDNPFSWQGLPFGEYTIAQSVLPEGFDTYLLRGPSGVDGSPETGYTVTIAEGTPDVLLRVYDFRAGQAG